MAASKTAICNMAIGHLGTDLELNDMDLDAGKEARLCRRYYNEARRQVFRDFPWAFLTKQVALALVAGTPNEFEFQYRVPSDNLYVRRLVSVISRFETPDSKIKFQLANDAGGALIWTDEVDAVIEYTAENEDVTKYPPDTTQAIALLLAVHLAPGVTGGDQFKLGERALRFYSWRIAQAQANARNEQSPERPPESEFIRARD